MKRERRYTIFKHSDIEKYLTEEQIEKLFELDSEISFRRQQEGRGLMSGLVIEKDWPEYEPAWAMIEKRVDSNIGTTPFWKPKNGKIVMTACDTARDIKDTPQRSRNNYSHKDLTRMTDAAMVEVQNLHPRIRRTDCKRIILAALNA